MKTLILLAALIICAQMQAQDSTTYKIYMQHQNIAGGMLRDLSVQHGTLRKHAGADAKTLETDIKDMHNFYVIVKAEIDTINKLPPCYLDIDRNARDGLYSLFKMACDMYNSDMAQLQSNYDMFMASMAEKQIKELLKTAMSMYAPEIIPLIQNSK